MLQLGNDVSPCLQQCRSERLYGLGGLTYTTPVTIGQATVNAGSLTAGEMPARAYPGLDALRGIAALLVALFHFRGNFLGYNNYPSGDGYLAVDVFFVLSGFVLSHAYLSRFARGMTVWQFVKIRLIRLYPLYFIGLMLGMVNLLAGYEPRGALSNLDIARAFTMELFMLPSWPTLYDRLFLINVVSWSLFFEMLVNILFVVFWKRLTPKALLRIIIASGLIVAAFSIYRHNASMGNFWRTSPIGLARTLLSFSMGILIYKLHRGGAIRFHASPLIFALAALLLVFCLLYPVPSSVRGYYDLIFIFLIGPLLVLLGSSPRLEQKWLPLFTFLGSTSYALYATHANGLPLVKALTERYFIHASVLTVSLLAVTLATLFAYALDIVYDRPVRKMLTARFGGKSAGGTTKRI